MHDYKNHTNAANDARSASNDNQTGFLIVRIKDGEGITLGDSLIMYESEGSKAVLKIRAKKHVKITRVRPLDV